MAQYPTTIIRDIVYTSTAHGPLALDLHLPQGAPTAPPMVAYFHGGAWELGERTDHEDARAVALARRGIAVATVQYRLTGTAPFPAQLDDARAAVAWLRTHGAEHGFDGSRIGSWGASAGGHLAALLGLDDRYSETPPLVSAAVPWFAPLDLAAMAAGSPLEEQLMPADAERRLLGGRYDRTNPAHRRADPLAAVSAGAAAFLVMTGDRDKIVDAAQSRRFHDALVAGGADSTLLVVGGAGHEAPGLESDFALDTVAAFFARRLVPMN